MGNESDNDNFLGKLVQVKYDLQPGSRLKNWPVDAATGLRPTHRLTHIALVTLLFAYSLVGHAQTGAQAATVPSGENADVKSAPAATAPKRAARATAKADTAPKQLGAVTVTAQRREQKIQDVPVPITVISGDYMEQGNIHNSNDIARLVPNFSAQSSGGLTSKPRWFLRGIGSNDPSVNLEGPIGIYQDDVFIALASSQVFPIYDQQRVEVLRGPQGTLWGKNTTGGAVNFISQKPTFDYDGYAKLGIANYGTRQIEAAVGGPIKEDALAGRVAFRCDETSGYAHNNYTGKNQPDYSDCGGRVQLLALVSSNFSALVNAHFARYSGTASPSYPIGINAGGADNYGFIPSYGANPQIGDPFYAGYSNVTNDTAGASVTLNYQIGRLKLTSISAIETAHDDILQQPGTPPSPRVPNQSGTYSHTDFRQLSQELRLASPQTDRLNWLIGYMYFDSSLDYQSVSATIAPSTRTAYLSQPLHQADQSNAFFGSATFNLTNRAALTGGVRYTRETKTVQESRLASGAAGSVVFNNPGTWWPLSAVGSSTLSSTSLGASDSWSQTTFDLTPQYKLSEDALVYGRFATGFRSGGFNPSIVVANGVASIPVAQPETLTDYELGIKTAWFDKRLILNAAIFDYQLKNLQLNVQTPNPAGIPNQTTSTLQNAANGKIQGLEFELQALPTNNLRLWAGLGFLNAHYTNFVTYQGTQQVDASGNSFYRTPHTTITAGLDYRVPVPEPVGGSLLFSTDWSYRSGIYYNAVIQNDPVQKEGGYTLGNVSLTYSAPSKKWDVTVYVNNVLNKSYVILSQVAANGAYPTALGEPRYVGVNGTFRW
ncbi:iron complex outermembrane recepter protein [Paraburkholderia lycopersici]|uniref:Iron complex outermembrane recepter protein n=2 Tax=Paraburkholderia lycopersici TaxID=416944 RepID=A0A1G6HB34_9BURK|nr:iron complex outermembrane recepter protein [Paraburkholderia lycopersici]